MNDSIGLSPELKRSCRMTIRPHSVFTRAINKYEIGNAYGTLCGGEFPVFIKKSDMSELTCPKAFSSVASAKRFMKENQEYVEGIDLVCQSNLMKSKTEGAKS